MTEADDGLTTAQQHAAAFKKAFDEASAAGYSGYVTWNGGFDGDGEVRGEIMLDDQWPAQLEAIVEAGKGNNYRPPTSEANMLIESPPGFPWSVGTDQP